MKKKQIFYEVIRSTEPALADEGDKKNFLDIVKKIRQKMEIDILSYCVTDMESHFLIHTQSERKVVLAVTAIIYDFQNYYRKRYQRSCKDMLQEVICRKYLDEEEIMESCMELHFLPLKEKLVKRPEDYWWSSYLEYRKNNNRGIVNTEMVLAYLDTDLKRAARKFVYLHNGNPLLSDK